MCKYGIAVTAGVIIFCLFSGVHDASGQGRDDGFEAVSRFLDGQAPEDMDAEDVRNLEDLLSRPLHVNWVQMEKLVESGLFSQYQAAALIDYRQRHGDILSVSELGAVDGIGPEYASRLSPFVSLQARTEGLRHGFSGEARTRAGMKCLFDGSLRWSAGARLSVQAGERFEAGLSFSKTLSGRIVPQALGGNLVWYPARRPFKIVAGDFNARFGQGLALWSGMGIGGVPSPSCLSRSSPGIVPSSSFSADYSFTGLAVQYSSRKFRISSALAFPDLRRLGDGAAGLKLLPVADFTWFAGSGRISLTGYVELSGFHGFARNSPPLSATGVQVLDAKTSISQSWSLNGSVLFSEISYDWKGGVPAGLAGVSFPVGEWVRLAAMLRYYPQTYNPVRSAAVRSRSKCSNEHSATFSGEFAAGRYMKLSGDAPDAMPYRRHSGTFYAEVSHIPKPAAKSSAGGTQAKAGVQWQFIPAGCFRFNLKLVEKYRSWDTDSFKTELRTDFSLRLMEWSLSARAHVSRCSGHGFLAYLEGGHRREKFYMYFRAGLFFIDEWQDRIYVYERDSPGAFNVPAFYGRGVWGAFSGGFNVSNWGRLYVRIASTAYPFAGSDKKKPGNAELKLYMKVRF